MRGRHDGTAGPVRDDEAAGADIPPPGFDIEALEASAAIDPHVLLNQLVDLNADGDSADLFGTSLDCIDSKALGIRPGDQQNDLSRTLIVPGTVSGGQSGAEVDQVLAHRSDRP